MSEFVLTLVQMDCLFGDPAGNFERAEAFVADAAGRGSDLVVLPELWHSSIDLENAEAYASPVAAGPVMTAGLDASPTWQGTTMSG